ncbi:Hpt domain-containing protein [Luteolibacter pohnpeiensis]|uniref:Hpt domain-containing protein n=1 Tax=Luteolibacter pohnpeiensis TaxID=454153 RepID=A0A934S8Q3_9BACT|nr:Hpt domain-containing protein [Luteolibacter pohnpeiensis]MBK1880893.1 Hpt domain-containing protein [Luteolibacter pohnpeiensis]
MSVDSEALNSNPNLLDYDQLSIFIDVGLDEFRTIFQDVVKDVPNTLATISNALAGGDEKTFRAQLHSLRGMLLNFGCIAIAVVLMGLEKAPELPQIAPEALLQKLTQLWESTRAALEAWADQAEAEGLG